MSSKYLCVKYIYLIVNWNSHISIPHYIKLEVSNGGWDLHMVHGLVLATTKIRAVE
jgi:hypothetical protein